MQRFFDIVLSAAAIVLLSPVLVLVMIALRVSGEGEVFYGQTRIGRNGRKFRILKFATMVKDSENRGAGTVTVKNDPRVLPLGRLLRKTKMNELPQLYTPEAKALGQLVVDTYCEYRANAALWSV